MGRAGRTAILAALLLAPAAVAAEDAPAPDERWAVHGQATFVLQGVFDFPDPYDGPNSLAPGQRKETFDATAYVGFRPWHGTEIWLNPEVDQGFGLSDTLGVAGFPSAEAYKVGKKQPYLRLQRGFIRQTIDLGGARTPVESTANQLGGMQSADRLVITAGKFGVNDLFDTNRYAHDPRGDLLNWAAVDAGSFDYAADAWGYSLGAAAELYRGDWTWRLGLFNLSKIPNGETLETGFAQYQIDAEVEHRHSIGGHPGAVRITAFRNRGRFGRYDDALAAAVADGGTPARAEDRRRRTRLGASLNAEQEVTGALGLFARAGVAGGQVEPYDFTDVDRTIEFGGSLAGQGWGRADDHVGLAAIVNDISREHRRFLAAGGLGVLVGDGRLPHPGREQIVEASYQAGFGKRAAISLDYQHVVNPGYNRDRGPANILAIRLHGAF